MTKKEQILEYFKDINVAYNNSTTLDTLKHMLEDLEEVVRCQDCKWCESCGEFLTTDENGFCSWGEREEDAKTKTN